jgi:hypothetical protein
MSAEQAAKQRLLVPRGGREVRAQLLRCASQHLNGDRSLQLGNQGSAVHHAMPRSECLIMLGAAAVAFGFMFLISGPIEWLKRLRE